MAIKKTPEAQAPITGDGLDGLTPATVKPEKKTPSFLRAMAYRLEDYIDSNGIDPKAMTVAVLLDRLVDEIHQLNRTTR